MIVNHLEILWIETNKNVIRVKSTKKETAEYTILKNSHVYPQKISLNVKPLFFPSFFLSKQVREWKKNNTNPVFLVFTS